MTATAGPRPCPFRPTAIRIWTMMTMRRGVPLLPWGGELHRPQQCPTASHPPPPSARPTMMKCSPFCRPTWTSWPGLTSTRWLSRHGEAALLSAVTGLRCIYLKDTSNFIDLAPLIAWILRVNGQCLKLAFVRPLSVSLGGDKNSLPSIAPSMEDWKTWQASGDTCWG